MKRDSQCLSEQCCGRGGRAAFWFLILWTESNSTILNQQQPVGLLQSQHRGPVPISCRFLGGGFSHYQQLFRALPP